MKYRFKFIYGIIFLFVVSCSNSSGEKEREVRYLCDNFGEEVECTFGPEKGICQRGIKTCFQTHWSECKGEILPEKEVCDNKDNDCDDKIDEGVKNSCGLCGFVPVEKCDGLDNNCNGFVDEGLSNSVEICNGEDEDCDGVIDEGLSKRLKCEPIGAGDWLVYNEENNTSQCSYGYQLCIEGSWTRCQDWVGPSPEVCDGRDNNCDGVVDNIEFSEPCGFSDIGSCEYGEAKCVDDELICIGSIPPVPEICDGYDNDCDGQPDEDLVRECETSCSIGLERCEFGFWVGCTAIQPSQEVCDGYDNDCNGLVDEGIECLCTPGDSQPCVQEGCGWGIQFCGSEATWGPCEGQISQPETCNNHDDNCNQIVDEDIYNTCYEGEQETLGVGVCGSGRTFCEEGIWSQCEGQVLPELESCNGLDDDCDGEIDNLEKVYEKVDMIFLIDISQSMDPYIDQLVLAIQTYVSSLEGTEHLFGIVVFGGQNNFEQANYYSPLSQIETFISSLQNLSFFTGSVEPSIDALIFASQPYGFFEEGGEYEEIGPSPVQISWRDDATPIFILFTDEEAQTLRMSNLNSIDLTRLVREAVAECHLPGCNSSTNENWSDGDPVEIYVFTPQIFATFWWEAIFNRERNVFNLSSDLESSELSLNLSLIFREICINN